jgi:hypothetical protein
MISAESRWSNTSKWDEIVSSMVDRIIHEHATTCN